MPNKIKVGVITQARGPHIDLYFASLAQTEEVEAVALADPTGQTAELAKKALGDRLKETYKDPAEMLSKFQPQMALVTMEADLAPPAIKAALDAGCHVLTEKPACVRADDFARLVTLAQMKHRHLMLALANRLHAPVQEARRLFQAGSFGKVYGVQLHLIADQTRLKNPEYPQRWYALKSRAGGGHLIWLGIHWLDLLSYITGLKYQAVAGFAGVVGGQPVEVEDSAAVALRFDNGSFGTMTSGYYLDKGYHSFIQIWGENGWLRLQAIEDTPMEWYLNKDGKAQKFEYPKGNRGYPPFVRAAVRASAELDPAPITGEEGLHVLRTIYAFYEAARSGKAQKV